MAYAWGWDEEKFLNSSLEYLFKTWVGKANEIERQERREWERNRSLATWILQPYSKGLTPQKLCKFPWENVVKTKEDWLKENKGLKEAFAKLKKTDGRTN